MCSSDLATKPVVSFVNDVPPDTMPDLRGLSAREALRAAVKLGLTARVEGTGFVVAQDPAPGASLDTVSACRVTLGRMSAAGREQRRP